MKTIKTIQQYATTYTISQQGNCSFRLAFRTPVSSMVKHLPRMFASVKAAEEYIATCKSMDMIIAMGCK